MGWTINEVDETEGGGEGEGRGPTPTPAPAPTPIPTPPAEVIEGEGDTAAAAAHNLPCSVGEMAVEGASDHRFSPPGLNSGTALGVDDAQDDDGVAEPMVEADAEELVSR